jgi:hypothetical protein
LSADLPPSKVNAVPDDFKSALRRVQDGVASEANVRSDRITALKIDSTLPVVTSEIDASQDVDAAVANWMKQRASQSNPST